MAVYNSLSLSLMKKIVYGSNFFVDTLKYVNTIAHIHNLTAP